MNLINKIIHRIRHTSNDQIYQATPDYDMTDEDRKDHGIIEPFTTNITSSDYIMFIGLSMLFIYFTVIRK